MSNTESKSLQFNNISWRASCLGEQVILLECDRQTPIEIIHQSSRALETILGNDLKDLVPAYHSVAIFGAYKLDDLLAKLVGKHLEGDTESSDIEVVELPICYEFGEDLDRMAQHTGMSIDEIIDLHLKSTYRSLFMGFTPGFIYADGLNENLACPRLDQPRTHIAGGSVGIAANQTGLYALPSPGGWNIIGRTPVKVFDPKRDPIMLVDVGAQYRFYRITQSEFESWEN